MPYEDDDEIINKIKTNTLVTTGQFDVGSTPDMAKNLSNQIEGAQIVNGAQTSKSILDRKKKTNNLNAEVLVTIIKTDRKSTRLNSSHT